MTAGCHLFLVGDVTVFEVETADPACYSSEINTILGIRASSGSRVCRGHSVGPPGPFSCIQSLCVNEW